MSHDTGKDIVNGSFLFVPVSEHLKLAAFTAAQKTQKNIALFLLIFYKRTLANKIFR